MKKSQKKLLPLGVLGFLAHLMVSYCGQSMAVVHHAASTIALKAYSSYTSKPIDSIPGRKHRGGGGGGRGRGQRGEGGTCRSKKLKLC